MQIIYVIISSILAVLSILPWITLNTSIDFLEIITFGLTGFVVFLPSLYALLSLFSALLLKKSGIKLFLMISSSLFFIFNLVMALVGIFGFQNP